MSKADLGEDIRDKLIGLGEASIRKSYYPELRSRLGELERFKVLLDQANDFIFLVESPGNLIADVNETALAALGFSRAELVGQAFDRLIPLASRIQLLSMFRRAEKALGCAEVVTSLIGSGGQEIPVEMRVRALVFEDRVVAVIVARDVTERIKGEEQLHRLRRLLSDMVDSMPSILIGLDPSGRVIQWNREAALYAGLDASKAVGAVLGEVMPGLAGEAANIEKAITQKKTVKDDRIPWSRDGQPGFADVTIYPLSEDGVPGAVIRVDDVTERTRLEEVMVQSEKMLTVGGLAAGMAHEINNPLAVILGNAQIIVSRLTTDQKRNVETAREEGISLEAMRGYLEKRAIFKMLTAISEAGGRAAQIVENMLSFSRLGGARPAPVSLSDLLDRTVDLAASDYDLKKKYDFKSIEIKREYESDTPPVVCDAAKIQQVFLNILKNGAQAMAQRRADGYTPFFIFRVKTSNAPAGFVRVEIEDNGVGMEESVRRRVFEPFFTTKDVGVGTGLGLSVSYFIVVENHGGALRVESEPGEGAVFIMELPAAGRKAETVPFAG